MSHASTAGLPRPRSCSPGSDEEGKEAAGGEAGERERAENSWALAMASAAPSSAPSAMPRAQPVRTVGAQPALSASTSADGVPTGVTGRGPVAWCAEQQYADAGAGHGHPQRRQRGDVSGDGSGDGGSDDAAVSPNPALRACPVVARSGLAT